MFNSVQKIFSLFDKNEKKKAYWLSIGMIIRGLVEVAGVASIMPFVAVVSNPEIIQTNAFLSNIYNSFGFESSRIFLLFLGCLVFVVIVFSGLLSAFTDWHLYKFTWMGCHNLATRLFAKYLTQPYTFFLNINTSELGANILNEINNYMKGILLPFMEIAARVVVSIFIFILLFIVDPLLACIVGIVLGGAYTSIFLYTRKKLVAIGKDRVFNAKKQYLYINESFTGIKDIKIRQAEPYFDNLFSKHSYGVNLNQASHQIISQIPKYALEIVAFGGILLIILYFVLKNQNIEETIPLMALYAFAGYRLMPALQKVFAGIATIRFNLALLNKLHSDLRYQENSKSSFENITNPRKPLSLHKQIDLRQIVYSYPNQEEPVLKSLNLKIKAKTTVGLVGATGAGKTTLIDLLLGLLEINQGTILVDGKKLTREVLPAWLQNIGYVPQQIFLSDQTIKENIALGTPLEDISDEAIIKAAKIANLHSFITDELVDGYDSRVGERGIRLSGGQKQRIGIARALYHDPEVLILDEATSSLDNLTENSVMQAINNLSKKKTILLIAHRLTTLKECDVIHFLSDGKVINSGAYDQLMLDCPEFKALATSRENRL